MLAVLFRQFISNYFLVVILSSITLYLLLVPLAVWRRRCKRNKEAAVPAMDALRAKYHAARFGFDMTHDDTLPPEIAALSEEERTDRMADEMLKLYKKYGYRPGIGAIPGIIIWAAKFVLCIDIGRNIPVGSIYAMNILHYIDGDTASLAALLPAVTVLGITVVRAIVSCTVGVVRALRMKRNGTLSDTVKRSVRLNIILSALSVILELLFVWKMSSSICVFCLVFAGIEYSLGAARKYLAGVHPAQKEKEVTSDV